MFNRNMLLIIAMLAPAGASTATTFKSGQGDISWAASAGLGYNSNVFQAPSSPYIDYAALPLGLNPTIVPQKKTGFFIPFEIKAEAAKNHNQDIQLLGSAMASGNFYLQSNLRNANEYSIRLLGGSKFILGRKEKSENYLYVGFLLGKHKQVYVDHDSGLDKTTTLSGTDISNRYSYKNMGLETKYKHRTGAVDFGFTGQYIKYDYEDPIAVSQLDHGYYRLGGDVSLPVASKVKLELTLDHSVRDYSYRHSHDATGAYKSASPLLLYTYNTAGATLRDRISPEWLLYLDYDQSQRTDAYVGYNDYKEKKYGARLLFEHGPFKSRLALHHWNRDYPNGFAFDVAGQGAKTYDGNDVKFKAESEQSKNASLWAELAYKVQHSTDLRYDFSGSQVMAGMSWIF